MITNEAAGIADMETMSMCVALQIRHSMVIVADQSSKSEGHAPMSHQTGATFSTLSDPIIALIALVKLCMATQMAKEQAPMFQDWNIVLDIDRITSMHAVKFAMGTRG